MNATEKRFEQNVLWTLKAAGEVKSWRYEAVKFRLANNTFYTPDFMVNRADGLVEFVDVKGSGGWEQHTRIKIKVCAEQYPEFVFAGYTEARGSRNRGEFNREEF
ncbi:hypothetical protein KOR34_02190 [Posidoniimonas corsicana]|uniref:DUF1064 domain-containing protein n=2 Tax=Posidoniimonas corsicana TaxID=1938618 RepID=A0A5C5VBW8_9BACT|nr:hypothetical protein KOR34_02190 [Posidoniimonas corsicana]